MNYVAIKKFILPALLFILVVLGVETYSNRLVLDYKFIDDDNLAVVQKMEKINQGQSAEKIIIFGSSMSREGIDVDYLKKELSRDEIYNLSMSNGKPSDFYLLFSRIKDKAGIKLAVINISQWMMQKKYSDEFNNGKDANANLFFLPAAAARICGFKNFNLAWFSKRTFVSFFPSLKYNSYLKRIIDHHNLSFWKLPSEKDALAVYSEYKYSANLPESYFVGQLKDENRKKDYSAGNYYWSEDDSVQTKSLGILLRELKKNNIPTMIVDAPVNPKIKELYHDGTQEKFLATVESLRRPSQNFYEMAFSYPKEDFIDFDHLNAAGRSVFSRDLAGLIKEK